MINWLDIYKMKKQRKQVAKIIKKKMLALSREGWFPILSVPWDAKWNTPKEISYVLQCGKRTESKVMAPQSKFQVFWYFDAMTGETTKFYGIEKTVTQKGNWEEHLQEPMNEEIIAQLKEAYRVAQ